MDELNFDKLDKLVAEKVFGRIWVTNRYAASGWAVKKNGDYLKTLNSWKGWVEPEIPEFSTDIAEAWRLVEELHKPLQLSQVLDSEEWSACFYGSFPAIGKTAPHAICLAALKTFEK